MEGWVSGSSPVPFPFFFVCPLPLPLPFSPLTHWANARQVVVFPAYGVLIHYLSGGCTFLPVFKLVSDGSGLSDGSGESHTIVCIKHFRH